MYYRLKIDYMCFKCRCILKFERFKMRLHLAYISLFMMSTNDVDDFIVLRGKNNG